MNATLPPQIRDAFKARPIGADKYSVGTVAVVGGSSRFANAPVMAGLGARVAGAGLVSLVVPPESRFAAGAILPEAMFANLEPGCPPPRADITVIGMGLGVSDASEQTISHMLSGQGSRFVLDADALSILAGWQRRLDSFAAAGGKELVLTPHEGEAARLLNISRETVAADRLGAAREIAARYSATVVLKGPRTLVVSPDGERVYENPTGNPFMALGGMGDLLAGMIGARWAYLKSDPFEAAASAVWLHGAASDRVVAAVRDPSILNTAAEAGALRVLLDGGEGKELNMNQEIP